MRVYRTTFKIDYIMSKSNVLEVIEALQGCASDIERREKLLELGFKFVEENQPDIEIAEEQAAHPENERQHLLISFFNAQSEPSSYLLEKYLAEKNADEPNYPLMRRYFRAFNSQLKRLILYGLGKDPVSLDLLDDLAFFNEFDLNLGELIHFYIKACQHAAGIHFEEIVRDFYTATASYG